MNLFENIAALTETKHVFTDEDLKDYSSYIINTAFSMSKQTVLLANTMNVACNTSDRMNKDFYQNMLPKQKIYLKWSKKDKSNDGDIDMIIKYYSCNKEIALQYLDILTKEQINYIKSQLDTGGTVKRGKK